ncbi:MAG TPA: hypothetical protein VF148_12835 [Acidimicrobiia bacterium]
MTGAIAIAGGYVRLTDEGIVVFAAGKEHVAEIDEIGGSSWKSPLPDPVDTTNDLLL